MLIYLNDGGGTEFAGGETCFLDTAAVETATASGAAGHTTAGAVPITPRAGRVVVFEHGLFHCGSPLVPVAAASADIADTCGGGNGGGGLGCAGEVGGTAAGAGPADAGSNADNSAHGDDASETTAFGAGGRHTDLKYVLRTDVLFGMPAFGRQASKETELEKMMRLAYENVDDEEEETEEGEAEVEHDDEPANQQRDGDTGTAEKGEEEEAVVGDGERLGETAE